MAQLGAAWLSLDFQVIGKAAVFYIFLLLTVITDKMMVGCMSKHHCDTAGVGVTFGSVPWCCAHASMMVLHPLLALMPPGWLCKLENLNVTGSEASRRNMRHLKKGLRAHMVPEVLDFECQVVSKWQRDQCEQLQCLHLELCWASARAAHCGSVQSLLGICLVIASPHQRTPHP